VGAKNVLGLRVAITNTGQQNHVPTCTAVCVVLAAREREHCNVRQISGGAVHGALFCGISHYSEFVNHPNCENCVL
jgi:hypothetical protein